MKKVMIICLLLVFLSSSNVLNNPIAVPIAYISEFLFQNDNDWILEIEFSYEEPYNTQVFDSLYIASSTGFSKINLDSLKENDVLMVIRSEDLITPLSFNIIGDNIKLYSYPSYPFPGEAAIDTLAFGNYPGSQFDSLKIGYSISKISFRAYSKDKSPTIGLPNDTSGTCGTLTGNIYNKNHEWVTAGNFELEYPVIFNVDGTYSTRVSSRKTVETRINIRLTPGQTQSVSIEPIYINLEPDSVVIKNINILYDYPDAIEDRDVVHEYNFSVTNYPNPFNPTTTIVFRLPEKSHVKLEIYNIAGQKIASLVNSELNSGEYSVLWNAFNQSSGIYLCKIRTNNISKSIKLMFIR